MRKSNLVQEKGALEQIGMHDLEQQQQIVLNYFRSLRALYASKWDQSSNAFLYGAGFSGAVDFLRSHLIDYCTRKSSFKEDTITGALQLGDGDLILQDELKGLAGAQAKKRVSELLVERFLPVVAETRKIEL